MLTKQDRRYALKRAKRWKLIGYTTDHIFSLSKRNSINCGCMNCRLNTYFRRVKNKKNRLKLKSELLKQFDEAKYIVKTNMSLGVQDVKNLHIIITSRSDNLDGLLLIKLEVSI